jgi:hypothetical protein
MDFDNDDTDGNEHPFKITFDNFKSMLEKCQQKYELIRISFVEYSPRRFHRIDIINSTLYFITMGKSDLFFHVENTSSEREGLYYSFNDGSIDFIPWQSFLRCQLITKQKEASNDVEKA